LHDPDRERLDDGIRIDVQSRTRGEIAYARARGTCVESYAALRFAAEHDVLPHP